MSMKRSLLLTVCPGLVAFCLAGAAEAQDVTVMSRTTHMAARQDCAALGPGYVRLQDTHGCVRIGGHIRVRIGDAGPFAPLQEGQPPVFGFPAPHRGDGPMRTHLRIGAGPR